jgi:hypothetical protein
LVERNIDRSEKNVTGRTKKNSQPAAILFVLGQESCGSSKIVRKFDTRRVLALLKQITPRSAANGRLAALQAQRFAECAQSVVSYAAIRAWQTVRSAPGTTRNRALPGE